MLEYIILFLSLSLYCILKIHVNNKVNIYEIFVISFLFSCLIANRGISAGNDTVAYYNMYQTMTTSGYWGFFSIYPRLSFEYFYWLEIFIITLFTKNLNNILFIQTFISICMLLYSTSKLTNKNIVALLFILATFTFYSFTGNVLRHGQTVGFFLLCIYFSKNKYYVKALICAVIGTMFHSAGAFSFVPIIISYLNLSYKNLTLLAIMLTMGIVIIAKLLSSFPLFQALLFYIQGGASLKINAGFLISIFVLAFVFFLNEKYFFNLEVKVYYFLFLIGIYTFMSSDASYRIDMMKFILEPIIIATSASKLSNMKIIIVISSFVYFLIMVNYTNFNNMIIGS